jgi:probable HAF family extracellular repeat protein
MIMNTRNYLITLAACCAVGVSSAGAQKYSVTDLGMFPDQKESVSAPAAINEQGHVAGTSGAFAFRYTKEMEAIGRNPVGSVSRGFGINNWGVVVGDSAFGKDASFNNHAAIFINGTTTDLGTLRASTLTAR